MTSNPIKLPGSLCLLALMLLAGTGISRAQSGAWEALGPGRAWVTGIAFDPSHRKTIYVSTYGAGVFKSLNGGKSWQPANSGLALWGYLNIRGVAIDRTHTDIVFAASQAGIFRSTNGGAGWNRVFDTTHIYAVRIDPNNSSVIYAAGGEVGTACMSKSTDGGSNWASIKTGLPADTVYALMPSSVTRDLVFAGTEHGLYRTTNGGASWTPSRSGMRPDRVLNIAASPANGAVVYAASGPFVYKSTDSGETWKGLLATATDAGALAIDPSHPDTIYGGMEAGVFKSTNGGLTWNKSGAGMPQTHLPASALAIDPADTNRVFAGQRGLYESSDGGATWMAANTGLNSAEVYSLLVDPANPQIIYLGDQYSLLKTIDGGKSWAAVLDDGVSRISISQSSPQTIYAVTRDGDARKTSDGGSHWATIRSGDRNDTFSNLLPAPAKPNILYASISRKGIFRSTDEGSSWERINPRNGALALDPVDADTAYLEIDDDLFRTTDGGATWTLVRKSPPDFDLLIVAVDPSDPNTIYIAGAGGVLKSTNRGANWVGSGGQRPVNVRSIAIDPTDSRLLYAASGLNGAFMSTDAGETWINITDGLPITHTSVVAIDPAASGSVYIGTFGAGAYRRQFKLRQSSSTGGSRRKPFGELPASVNETVHQE